MKRATILNEFSFVEYAKIKKKQSTKKIPI